MRYEINKNNIYDFSKFEDNKNLARSYFVPFNEIENLNACNAINERYFSDCITILNGEWSFKYYERNSLVETVFDTDSIKFDNVIVPSTWQRTGYENPAYINQRYEFPLKPPVIPADKPVAFYKRSIEISTLDKEYYLTFLGVSPCINLYVNGKYVGYSEGSHNPHEFNITNFLTVGENEILAQVDKFCNGSYLECQDQFRENGIFRDVYLTAVDKNHLFDYKIEPIKADKGYVFNFFAKVKGNVESISYSLLNSKSMTVAEDKLIEENGNLKSTKFLENIVEWNAEIPTLYTLIITIKTEKGESYVRQLVGFKNVKIDKEVFLFNGQPIKMLGTNHHDTDPKGGFVMTMEQLERDVKLMKEFNCNTVRTSHYPPDPMFLTMCDIYGLYVVDEADIETHGTYCFPKNKPNQISNNVKWAEHYLDRVKRMYERDKNHASIAMWSLGNESGGYKCQDVCYDFLKNNDSIPVHYEGVIRSKRFSYDVVSHMYAPHEKVRNIGERTAGDKYLGKPFFQCEYAHAMGNGPGSLEEYVQLFYQYDNCMGGCIWEFADHAVYHENGKYKYTYGGDHNEKIHDGNFCVDGLFYPDRRPHTGAYNMKAVYRPLRISRIDVDKYEVKNLNRFKSSDYINIDWIYYIDGREKNKGKLNLNVLPNDKTVVEIENKINENNDCYIDFIYTNKETGLEIAKEQLILCQAFHKLEIKNKVNYSVNGNLIEINCKDVDIVFTKDKGELVSYRVKNKEIINTKPIDRRGLIANVYRVPMDNDRNIKIWWHAIGLDKLDYKVKKVKIENDDCFSIEVKYTIKGKLATLYKGEVKYKIDSNGNIIVKATVKKASILANSLPRFGLSLELDKQFENVKYYGKGEKENLPDFDAHSMLGVYETTVAGMFEPYIKPQFSGNRTNVRWADFTNNSKEGIRFITGDKGFNFSASNYTMSQLKECGHTEDVPNSNTIYVAIDGLMRGTGSNSCGPLPLEKYKLKAKYKQKFKFAITPVFDGKDD